MKLFGKYQNVKEMLAKEDKNVLQQKFPHGKPMSRRDLLQAGAIGFAATVTLPPFLGMLAKPEQALAQAACEESQLPGFITMNLSGGAAMGSNILPLTQSLQMLGSYSILGLGSTAEAA